jgi:hypothetical protein
LRSTSRGSLLLAVVGLLALLSPVPAQAAPSPWKQMQKEINQQLRTTEGGVQISPNEVSYHQGRAVLTFVLPGDTTVTQTSARIARGEAPGGWGKQEGVVTSNPYSHNCPYSYIGGPDWYCFFEHINYSGRMLKWSNEHCHDGVVNFWDWNFENMTSSMVNNNSSVYVRAESLEFSDSGRDARITGSGALSSMPSGMNDNAEHADVCKR